MSEFEELIQKEIYTALKVKMKEDILYQPKRKLLLADEAREIYTSAQNEALNSSESNFRPTFRMIANVIERWKGVTV